MSTLSRACFFFFFNDTATTEIYTLSLHDALPISALTVTLQSETPRIQTTALLGDGRFVSLMRSGRSEEHTSELQSQSNLVCRLLLEKKKQLRNPQHRARRSISSVCDSLRLPACSS